jgi:membrane protein implicated in regulation of membrane protease activity
MKVCSSNRHSNEKALTLFELLAAIIVIFVPFLIGSTVTKSYGIWSGIGAGFFSAIVCIALVIVFYRVQARQLKQRRDELRGKYKQIYRVLTLPTDETRIKKPEGSEIKVGDYGWEAVPLRNDGLIYLQGLNPQWRVVWYAGFSPDQIESVASKPQSQYDWNYTWIRNPPPCPFPVQERETNTMGFPPFRVLGKSS